MELAGEPHLCFFSTEDINIGDELLYDYGDKTKDVLRDNKWLVSYTPTLSTNYLIAETDMLV